VNGVLVIDKPAGLTSHDVVNRIRRLLHQRSVGHLGTLDPSATGVLPLAIGNLTRLSQFYNKSEKAYEGIIHFGFSTDTYDAEGEPMSAPQPVLFGLDELRTAASRFTGLIEQMPPRFSAKKIDGIPAYKLARKHKDFELKPVQVEIAQLEILSLEDERAFFRARVSSGTYMRSLAHDLGRELGCGAHLQSLRRTSVAEFQLDDAHTLEKLESTIEIQPLSELFVHPRKLLPSFPSVTTTPEDAALIRTGRPVNLPEMSRAKLIKVFLGQSELIAIATRVAGTLFHPGIVFVTEPENALAGRESEH
jgi:tRNA pseudouridine55 synthase